MFGMGKCVMRLKKLGCQTLLKRDFLVSSEIIAVCVAFLMMLCGFSDVQ